MRCTMFSTAVVLALLPLTEASASILLTFESLANCEQIAGFYAPNVTFSGNALALVDQVTGHFNNQPVFVTLDNVNAGGTSEGAMGVMNSTNPTDEAQTTLNVVSGYNFFGFSYALSGDPGTVSVYSGSNGGGTLLYEVDLEWTDNEGEWDSWRRLTTGSLPSNIGSIVLYVPRGDLNLFDDFEFGTLTDGDGNVPEPATLAIWSLLAVTGLGAGCVRRRKSA